MLVLYVFSKYTYVSIANVTRSTLAHIYNPFNNTFLKPESNYENHGVVIDRLLRQFDVYQSTRDLTIVNEEIITIENTIRTCTFALSKEILFMSLWPLLRMNSNSRYFTNGFQAIYIQKCETITGLLF